MGTVPPPRCDDTREADYREGAARLRLGPGFFQPDSRTARDLTVLLCARLGAGGPVRMLDLMSGCGIRALRCGLEAGGGIQEIWANDGDADRLELIRRNLAPLRQVWLQEQAGRRLRCTALPAHDLLAHCRLKRHRFDLVDLDGFGSISDLVPAVLPVLAFGGVLVLTSSDGRSPTGHDRIGAVRHHLAAARAHPCSWEIALRLQLALIARSAWAMGHDLEPLLQISDGRTFRSAVRLRRRLDPASTRRVGLLGRCDACGDQQLQPLLRLNRWPACCCSQPGRSLAVSGPLWLGPLQNTELCRELLELADARPSAGGPQITRATRRQLQRLTEDPGLPALCWSLAELGRRIGGGPPPQQRLLERLRQLGHRASASAIAPGRFRTEAPWPEVLRAARDLSDV
ncbi:N2,N2-dimethylguanosine tRNA methyltransferase [Synechococcus sp. RSCCF101]|uniref:N2,N2-dimethylguanosine tRNA methyltransferase n=1 Tax=Synechococcus sp. RSCCF101 TaxID=2511069 RepID=UPI001243AFF5|nr:N2,N2-dimethylguanosine tRNA methyltransferase [Synechococcus sp. RSCCF101]QEY31998.1 N2,N2-dimethylguanosine tRNA methyltransferase [Synechococcus sp. RSCCF101]